MSQSRPMTWLDSLEMGGGGVGGGAAATLAPPETGTEGARNTCGARNRNGGRPQHMRHREQEGRATTTLALPGTGTESGHNTCQTRNRWQWDQVSGPAGPSHVLRGGRWRNPKSREAGGVG